MKSMTREVFDKLFLNVQQTERWPAGMILFSEGEQPRGLFMVHSGIIDLMFSARNGDSKSLRVARPGELLGLSYAVTNNRYDCTARARTSVEVGFVPLPELQRMLDEAPHLWFTIAQFISTDLDTSWASMRTLSAAR